MRSSGVTHAINVDTYERALIRAVWRMVRIVLLVLVFGLLNALLLRQVTEVVPTFYASTSALEIIVGVLLATQAINWSTADPRSEDLAEAARSDAVRVLALSIAAALALMATTVGWLTLLRQPHDGVGAVGLFAAASLVALFVDVKTDDWEWRRSLEVERTHRALDGWRTQPRRPGGWLWRAGVTSALVAAPPFLIVAGAALAGRPTAGAWSLAAWIVVVSCGWLAMLLLMCWWAFVHDLARVPVLRAPILALAWLLPLGLLSGGSALWHWPGIAAGLTTAIIVTAICTVLFRRGSWILGPYDASARAALVRYRR